MNKRILAAVVFAAAAATMSGCYSAPVKPPVGLIYADISAPLDFDSSNSAVGSKSGTSEAIGILGLVSTGDASLKTAAKNGGIETITGADYNFTNIIGVYQKFETVAHGE